MIAKSRYVWIDEGVYDHLSAEAKGYESRNDTLRRLLGLSPRVKPPRKPSVIRKTGDRVIKGGRR